MNGKKNTLIALLIAIIVGLLAQFIISQNQGSTVQIEDILRTPYYINENNDFIKDEAKVQQVGDDVKEVEERILAIGLEPTDIAYSYEKSNLGFIYRPSENRIIHVYSPSFTNNRVAIHLVANNQDDINDVIEKLTSEFGKNIILTSELSNITINSNEVIDLTNLRTQSSRQIATYLNFDTGNRSYINETQYNNQNIQILILIK